MSTHRFLSIVIVMLITSFISPQQLLAQNESRGVSSLKKSDFLKLADGNDTLEALPHLFFRKRKEAQTVYILAGATFPVFVLGSAAFAVGTGLSGGDDPEEKIQAGAVVFSVVFYVLIIGSSHRLIRYSKSRLNNLMQTYPVDGKIPKPLRNKLRPNDFSSN